MLCAVAGGNFGEQRGVGEHLRSLTR
jgi:hypothetical protein